jgi:hypothetical protein
LFEQSQTTEQVRAVPTTYKPNTNPKSPERAARRDRMISVRIDDRLYEQIHKDAVRAGIRFVEAARRRLASGSVDHSVAA